MNIKMQHRQQGATALEFVIVFPLLILILLGSLALALMITQNLAISSVASETARCLSISSPACTEAPPADCGTSDAGVCYAIKTSRIKAFWALTAKAVTINQTSNADGIGVVHVSIEQPLSLFGLMAPTIRAQAEAPLASP